MESSIEVLNSKRNDVGMIYAEYKVRLDGIVSDVQKILVSEEVQHCNYMVGDVWHVHATPTVFKKWEDLLLPAN